MSSYSVKYLFKFLPTGIPQLKKMGKVAAGSSKSVHKLGSGVKGLSMASTRFAKSGKAAALSKRRMGESAHRAIRGVEGLRKGTAATAKAADAAAQAANRSAGGFSAMGRAAAAAQAKVKALAAAANHAAAAALYARGYGAMGPNEKAARAAGQGAHGVIGGQKADRELRDKFLRSRGGDSSGSGGGGSRGGGTWGRFSGAMRIGAGAGMSSRLFSGGPGGIATAAGGYAAYSGLKNFADFQSAEIYAHAVGKRLGQSKPEVNRLSNLSRRLGAETIFEPQDVLGGGLKFLKAGRTASEARMALPHTLNLAAAAEMDVTAATETALNMMALAGVEAKDLGKAVDTMTGTFLNSKVEMTELAKAAPYLLPKLRALGVPLEQQFAALGALSEAGQGGSRGARGLSMAIQQIQKAPFMKKQRGLMKKFGFNSKQFFDDDGKLADFGGLFKEIKRVQESSKGQFISNFFPANAARVVESYIQALEVFDRVVKNAPTFGGGAKDLAASKFKGITGAIKQLGAAWSELGITFGKSGVGKAVEGAVRAITKSMGDLKASIDIGSFLDELFDPGVLMGRVAGIAARLSLFFHKVLVVAFEKALNGFGRLFGNSTLGTAIREGLGLNEMLANMQTAIDEIDRKTEQQKDFVRTEAANRKLGKAAGFSGGAAAALAGGTSIPKPPMGPFLPPVPSANPNRIPQAEAQRVRVESLVRTQIDPVQVNMDRLQVEYKGPIGGPATVGGTASPSRGTSTVEAGAPQ